MNNVTINRAVVLARNFIFTAEARAAAIAKSEYISDGDKYYSGCPKESGTLRRASMDLTRALADMRKPER